jgi:hypothetical protein
MEEGQARVKRRDLDDLMRRRPYTEASGVVRVLEAVAAGVLHFTCDQAICVNFAANSTRCQSRV